MVVTVRSTGSGGVSEVYWQWWCLRSTGSCCGVRTEQHQMFPLTVHVCQGCKVSHTEQSATGDRPC